MLKLGCTYFFSLASLLFSILFLQILMWTCQNPVALLFSLKPFVVLASFERNIWSYNIFYLGYKRHVKSDQEEDIAYDTPVLDRRGSRSETHCNRVKGKMSFRAASHATLTFLSARKRIEDGIKTLGRRMSRRSSVDGNTLNSF